MGSTKRIIITGASGYLGQHILHSLMTKGPPDPSTRYEIFALYTNGGGTFASRVIGTTRITPQVTVSFDRLDLTKEANVKEWVSSHKDEPIDVCLHLAALSSPAKCHDNPDLAHAINCPTVFFQALSKANVGAVVSMSTDQVYNGTEAPYTEENSAVDPVNVYGSTKVAMEKALAEHFPNKFVALRSSIIAGPEAPFGNAHGTFLHFCKSRKGVATDFYTDECRSVIAVTNVVTILTHFVENGISSPGIYNMGGKNRVSRYDMAMGVARFFQFDEQCVVAKKKQDQSPPPTVQSPLDIAMDSTKLEQLVGFPFLGYDDIVKETFATTSDRS